MRKRVVPAILAGLALAGCGSSAKSGAGEMPSEAPISPAPLPKAVPVQRTVSAQKPLASDTPAPMTPDEKGEKGAQAVLATWARALEDRQFGLAWAQFGHPPSTQAAFGRWWQRNRMITVQLGDGDAEGAAGSIYYTAPATVSGVDRQGRPYRLQGDVVLRRVNDVDGATPAQLRWHIESADLKAVQPL